MATIGSDASGKDVLLRVGVLVVSFGWPDHLPIVVAGPFGSTSFVSVGRCNGLAGGLARRVGTPIDTAGKPAG